jgi:DNA invertase Pin-like site-specific DNA recombinase
MAKGNFIAYYRVSTAKQGASGLGLEAQQKAVLDTLNGGNWKLQSSYTEIETGKNNDRPKLKEALQECRLTSATLIVAKLDRLARNLVFIGTLMESGVDFVACDMPSANKLTIHILAAVAQAEAEAISHRTKVALAAAKARGTKLGGNRGKLNDETRKKACQRSAEVRQKRVRARQAELLPLIQTIRNNGALTFEQVAAELNRRNIDTPQKKGPWQAAQVYRILQRSNTA